MGKTQVLGTADYENLGSYFGTALSVALLTANASLGFKRSGVLTDSIADSATQGAIKDFAASYGFLVVRFTNCQRVQASTKLQVDVGMTDADTLCRVYDSTLQSSDLATIPNGSGLTMQVVIPQAMGFRRARVTLSLAASGGAVPLEMYGLDLVTS